MIIIMSKRSLQKKIKEAINKNLYNIRYVELSPIEITEYFSPLIISKIKGGINAK